VKRVFGERYLTVWKPPQIVMDPRRWHWTPDVPRGRLKKLGHRVDDKKAAPLMVYEPRGSSNKELFVLLFGCFDPAFYETVSFLRREKVPHAIVHWEWLAIDGEISFSIEGGQPRGVLRWRDREVDLSRISSVFYVPTTFPLLEEMVGSEAGYRRVLPVRRWHYALQELHAAMPGVPWFPAPPLQCDETAQRKLSELFLARSFGLDVPETVCTNSPDRAEEFHQKGRRPIVFREWTTRRVKLGHKKDPAYFRVMPVDPKFRDKGLVADAPVIFQAYVDKLYELRVIVLEDEVFAVKIDSQASPKERFDWRVYDLEHVSFHRYRLPAELSRRIGRFVKHLGLRFASADLIRARDGRYVLLEVNRPGAWGFFDCIAGLGVTARIGVHLVEAARAFEKTRR
jgi:hypothetical protein